MNFKNYIKSWLFKVKKSTELSAVEMTTMLIAFRANREHFFPFSPILWANEQSRAQEEEDEICYHPR